MPIQKETWTNPTKIQVYVRKFDSRGNETSELVKPEGGKKAFADLLQAFQVQIATDQVNIVPVVTMTSDSYEHKQYGTIFNPLFTIVKWISLSGVAVEPAAEDGEDEAEDVKPQPEPLHAAQVATPAKPAAKPRRGAVGGGAPAEATKPVETVSSAAKPAVVRQRRRPAA